MQATHPPLSRVRGAVLRPTAGPAPGATDARRGFTLIADALVEIDPLTGRVHRIGPAPADCAEPETAPGAVWLPGFVDTHLHFPQTRIIGSATGPLLDWLARSVFPEESRFVEKAYAEAVAAEFCAALTAAGTTTAAIYSSSDPGATHVLFEALHRAGLRGDVGLTLMDLGAPPALCVPVEVAVPAVEALVARWHGQDHDRLRFVLTPRFALSCSPALLRATGDLAEKHGLWVQTHIAENRAEIAAVAEVFPDAVDYLNVYEHFGLVGPRTLLAHCVWFDGPVWDRAAAAGLTVTHCPDSNFFLGSGAMRLSEAVQRGLRVGLGTDVGAGRTFSVLRVAASAYDAARIHGDSPDAEALLWHATAGGGQALGRPEVGRLDPGSAADLVALDVPPYVLEAALKNPENPRALYEALVFRHDQGPVRHTVVGGRQLR